MITLILPSEASEKIRGALQKAGRNEVGGVLLAEHMCPGEFEIRDLTVHRRGAFASFVRKIEEALAHITSFFERANRDYVRFNYIGEWHSHPSFEPEPSPKDDASMMEIVQDPEVGANFVVLLVVKLNPSGQLLGSIHTYLPNGRKYQSVAILGSITSRQVLQLR
jgi:[CysO sulfur-carrier protein]-S-L-cysteine hydrolase